MSAILPKMTSGINLFIAPLDKRIDDAFLRNEFGKFGDLFSADVAKDDNGESKGYGFVNFCSSKDGLIAMKEMTGKTLLGRITNVRLANNQIEAIVPQVTSGISLYIASLDKLINDEFLRHEFGKFGDLFSAYVAKDESGESKCYGFVNFCSSKDGLTAMKEMTGKRLLGRIINVQLANNQKEAIVSKETPGINLFIASLDKLINDKFLRHEFDKFGDLFSAVVAKDENGESKGYGFVNFCSSKDGLIAMKEMNGKRLLGRIIDVQLANNQKEGSSYNAPTSTMWTTSLNKDSSPMQHKPCDTEYDKLSQISDDQRSCYNGPTSTIWIDSWNKDSSPLRHEPCDTEYVGLSQMSDAACDQNSPGQWDIKERMKSLFETQMYTDVKFFPKNNRSQSISAHRAVLAVGSPLFQKMLFSESDKDTAGMKMEVQISNMAFDAFTNIVKYIYTDEVFFESDALVQEILDGARQFGIHRLVNRCKQYFESLELTNQNVFSKLQHSIANKIDALKERCIEFIQKNTLQVINSPEIQHCTPNTMRVICKLQSLNLHSEKELLDAVMKWLYTHPPQSRKQMMEPLLKCVRFLTFTVNELADTLKEHSQLLKSEDGLNIMLYLHDPPNNPNFQNLPSWLNKNTNKRCFFRENPRDTVAEPTANGPSRFLIGKMSFPLKPEPRQSVVTELTSLLQMKCISGLHEIKAIKLIFEKPQSHRSVIENLTIKIHRSPISFETKEVVKIVSSEMVRVELKRVVRVRRGDLVDVEVEAKNAKFYKFLQFDDAYKMSMNPHFQCCVVSRPIQESKLFFIGEVEYGPQLNVYKKIRPDYAPQNPLGRFSQ